MEVRASHQPVSDLSDHPVAASEAAVTAAPPVRSVDQVALTATLNCLVGCATGEVVGMVVGTAFGWGNLATVVLAIGLAFVFGYTLTSIPLRRSGMPLRRSCAPP
jgi:outer membrane lipoprotein SlyB